MAHEDFDMALSSLKEGYTDGFYQGRRYGVSVHRSQDGRRIRLFARELAGKDIVSFNLYRLGPEAALKPCEMSVRKVRNFVREFRAAEAS